jgi:hypothetical protein
MTYGSFLLQYHYNQSPYRYHDFDHLDNFVHVGIVGYQFQITERQAFNIGMSFGSHSSSPESILIAGITKEF